MLTMHTQRKLDWKLDHFSLPVIVNVTTYNTL